MNAQVPGREIIPDLPRRFAGAFAPVQREVNRFFEELGDGLGAFVEPHFAPRLDIVENKHGLNLSVELPGMTQDDVKVEAEDDVLTISGEKSSSEEKAEGQVHMTERAYGAFSRSIFLPRSVDPARITATMKDGVLKVAIPKRDGVERKTIEIQSK